MSAKLGHLPEPVVFRSNRRNLRVQVCGAPSETTDPDAAVHPGVKMAEFMDGIYATDDPEIVKFLDARPDVWRGDDVAAELKAQYGPEEFERLSKVFGSAQAGSPAEGEE